MPDRGALLTSTLAEVLGVGAGDTVTLELREGDRRHVVIPVIDTVDEAFGLQAHARLVEVQRMLGEGPVVNMALLLVDPELRDTVLRRLKAMPDVLAIGSPDSFERQFEEQSADTMRVFTLVLTIFASILAVGIVYNNARVALSTRARDLASLRVLGFTRGEISAILFNELAVQVLVAIPLGLAIGRWMAFGILSSADPEAYRLPVVISSRTYAFATVVTLVAAFLSAWLGRRSLDRLDLIAALKTRD
jgi:putative ABC transport system permease protein